MVDERYPLRWSYGITTVPGRRLDLLPRTLDSLRRAGFDAPRLFLDGAYVPYNEYGGLLNMTLRYPAVRAFGNWILALWELYLRDPKADRYALFQDDLVCVRGLRSYLDGTPYPEQGYLNLFTMASNEQVAGKPGHEFSQIAHRDGIPAGGWYRSNQLGRSALGLVFSREAVEVLLSSKTLARKPQDERRGHKSIDGAVVTAMLGAGWSEYVHMPSLLQHTGEESTLENGRHVPAGTFPGEDFDARVYLGPAQVAPS